MNNMNYLQKVLEGGEFPLLLKYTVETNNGELAIRKLKNFRSNLHQTGEYLFRSPNYKKII